MNSNKPSRGEVWMANFEPVEGHEQGGKRLCLVLSEDIFNHSAAGLVVVLPITSRIRGIPLHVLLVPPAGGMKMRSVAMPEMIRSISTRRLIRRLGKVSPGILDEASDRLSTLLGISWTATGS